LGAAVTLVVVFVPDLLVSAAKTAFARTAAPAIIKATRKELRTFIMDLFVMITEAENAFTPAS
jgi:hypothetical protein